MKRILHLIPFTMAFLLAACAPTHIVTSVAPVDTMLPVTVAVNTPAAGANGAAAQPTSAAPNAPAPQSNAGPVALQVRTPQDGDVVSAAQIPVQGVASPGAVVTVNDQILIAGPDGSFSTTVALDEGPNLVEVIASNGSGSEVTLDLTVTYQP